MQQNAQLRAAAASMSDYVDRIAAQVSAVLAPHAPQHAAYGWYVHYMEERIEEMRKQVERANQVVDGAESMLHLGDELGKEEDLPTGGVREANAAKAAAAEMAGLPAVAQGTRRYSIYGGGAPDAAPPHPSQERPLRRSVSFGTQGPSRLCARFAQLGVAAAAANDAFAPVDACAFDASSWHPAVERGHGRHGTDKQPPTQSGRQPCGLWARHALRSRRCGARRGRSCRRVGRPPAALCDAQEPAPARPSAAEVDEPHTADQPDQVASAWCG